MRGTARPLLGFPGILLRKEQRRLCLASLASYYATASSTARGRRRPVRRASNNGRSRANDASGASPIGNMFLSQDLRCLSLQFANGREGSASAATYNVGEPGGSWTLNTDYSGWVANKKFHPGDEIVFKYASGAHDVVEVSKANYDSCSAANAITTLTSGNDVVPLTAVGTRYFICGIPGHCSSTTTTTMKVTIDVVAGSSSPSSPMPADGPGAGSSPSTPPPSAATSVQATAGFGLVALLVAGLMA